MKPIFSELKSARESNGISLSDVAEAIRIKVHYLEAIEEGNTAILPPAYLRAIIREYAAVVGLKTDHVMLRLEEAMGTTLEETAAPQNDIVPPPPLPHGVGSPETDHQPSRPIALRAAVVALVVCGVTIGTWNILRRHTPPHTRELATQKAGMISPTPAWGVSSLPVVSDDDSLTLYATTNDSVWIKIGRDALEPQQYFLPPHTKTFWRAEQMFWVSIGNAGGVEFTLNEKRLGVFGKRRTIIRDLLFTRQQLSEQ
jgi:transcriptional regulator with XRE-family HTH domain